MKPILLILEGMDKSGKTTIINYINKKTNYTPLILDRGPIGYKVYSELYNKETTPSDYDALEKELCKIKHLCVYLYAFEKDIQTRCLLTNEPKIDNGIAWHLQTYQKYYEASSLNKIKINTSSKTFEEIFSIIKQECDNYE